MTGRRTAVAALLLLLPLAGCGLFEPRDPRPATDTGPRCRGLTAPDSLAINIEEQYGTLAGVTCFTSILDNSYLFHPDVQDSIDALPDSIYRNWNRTIESRVATNLAADAVYCAAVFDSQYAAPSVSPDLRTEVRFYAYHVLLRTRSAPDTTRYQGLADLTFHQESGFWHLTSWVDKRDASGLSTWGALRRTYRTGF